MDTEEKRGPGRPKGSRKYEDLGQDYGAPKLTVRLSPDVLGWLKAQPEGARATIEGLVRAAMKEK